MLATVPVMAIVAVFFGRYIRKLSKEAQDYIATSNSILEEALTGIANVKAFTNEWFLLGKYKKSTQQSRDLNVRSGIWRGLFVSFIIFCLFGAIVFIVWKGLLMTQGPNPELASEGFYQFVLFTIMMGASIGSFRRQLVLLKICWIYLRRKQNSQYQALSRHFILMVQFVLKTYILVIRSVRISRYLKASISL
jgi:ABC-type multidrug transport system fused ATPase/permease subunit